MIVYDVRTGDRFEALGPGILTVDGRPSLAVEEQNNGDCLRWFDAQWDGTPLVWQDGLPVFQPIWPGQTFRARPQEGAAILRVTADEHQLVIRTYEGHVHEVDPHGENVELLVMYQVGEVILDIVSPCSESSSRDRATQGTEHVYAS